ncbi:hypothetical protein [Legionella sp.]|uniref:hypothetical protein n=1 Tax=Legionella sp. TaxID=459 RepID=UPI003D0E2108
MFYLVLGVDFLEPTGYWNDVSNIGLYWDRALMVASYAALGILAADFAFYLYRRFFYHNNDALSLKKQTDVVPMWYLKNPGKIWGLLVCICLVISCINFKTHFYMVGLLPTVIFPFHLNFLLTWGLIFFLPLLIAHLMGWDAIAHNYKNWHYAMIIACLISITALSRSILIVWIVPCFFILFKEGAYKLVTQHKKLLITYVALAIISLCSVSMLRSYYFYAPLHKPTSINEQSDGSMLNELIAHNKSNLKSQLQQVMSLPVSRWIGIEGILATTAYPDGGTDLFKKAIFQKTTQKISVYSKVSQSYLDINQGTIFSSLPGLIGILNYSNNYMIVGYGTFIVCLLMCFIQFFYYRLGLNTYFLSLQGFLLAFFLTELNIPYLGVINLFEFILASSLLVLIQKSHILFPRAFSMMRQGLLKKEGAYKLVTQHKKLLSTYVALVIISLCSVSMLCSYYFYAPLHKPTSINEQSDGSILNELIVHNKSNLKSQLQQVMSLPVSRWIGIEGILATTAYPDGGTDLFKKAIFQKTTQKISVYSKVSQSYLDINQGTIFSSLPGLIGILNYSNNYMIVGYGTFIVCLLMCFIQFFYYRLGLNTYFLSLQGFLLAFFLTELNIPYLGVINLFEFILASSLLVLIQKSHVLFSSAFSMLQGLLKIEAQNSC